MRGGFGMFCAHKKFIIELKTILGCFMRTEKSSLNSKQYALLMPFTAGRDKRSSSSQCVRRVDFSYNEQLKKHDQEERWAGGVAASSGMAYGG